jgi:cytochrome c-type biogenesis protein
MLPHVLSFAAGLLTTLSPCVLPLLPIVVGSATSRSRWGPLAMGAGLAAAFTLVGVSVAAAGGLFGLDEILLRRLSALVLLAAGITLLSPALEVAAGRAAGPLARAASALAAKAGDGLSGQFVIGAALGGIWSPCAGPTLGAAIGLAAQANTRAQASLLMLTFSLGTTVPLVATAYVSRRMMGARGRLMKAGLAGKTAFALVLVAAGILIWTGGDKALEAWLVARLPQWWVDLLASV